MKKIFSILLIALILLQSCSVYKKTAVNDLKIGKNYIIVLDSGKEIEARCASTTKDAAYFKINENSIKVPFDEIKSLKRKKVSPVILIGGSAAAVLIGVLVIESNKKEPIIIDGGGS